MTYRVTDLRNAIELAFDSVNTNGKVPVELFCRVLSAPRRIVTLAYVLEADEPLSVEALASSVGARETIDRDECELSVLLYHCDLPLLADAGLISVDPDAGRVAPTMTASSIADNLPSLTGEPA